MPSDEFHAHWIAADGREGGNGDAVARFPYYGLGLMTGSMGGVGRAFGHSGGGPFCVNAVYHFPERAVPVTVACFTDGENEGRAEFQAARLAETLGA